MFKIKLKILVVLISAAAITSSAQELAGYYGFISNSLNKNFRLSGLEENMSNYNSLKDMELSLTFGGEMQTGGNPGLYSSSLAKRFGKSYFYGRITPGLRKDFSFDTGTGLIFLSDSSEIKSELKSEISFREIFGLGYAYSFNQDFSAGVSLRLMEEVFTSELPVVKFENNAAYLSKSSSEEKLNTWTVDFGFNWMPEKNLNLSVSSKNLIRFESGTLSDTNSNYTMRKDIRAVVSAAYSVTENLRIIAGYESLAGYSAGLNYGSRFGFSSVSGSAAIMKLNDDDSIISGLLASVNYSTGLIGLTLTGVKNFNYDRENLLLSDFKEKKMSGFVFNKYTDFSVYASLNLTLSLKRDKVFEMIEKTNNERIFPSNFEEFIDKPFAEVKITNISDNKLRVYPSLLIKELNPETIASPLVILNSGDTVSIPVYFHFPDKHSIKNPFIAQAEIALGAENTDDEIRFSFPVMIESSNSWDGNVRNLGFFAVRSLGKMSQVSKKALAESEINGNTEAGNFIKTKYLFEYFSKGFSYTADFRASSDRVQYPEETLELKGGDCDDFAVFFSSVFESVGIETAFIDYRYETEGQRHVALLVNTNLQPENAGLITKNDSKYYVFRNSSGKDEIWIPLETTVHGSFDKAWSYGAEEFVEKALDNFGLEKNKVEIIKVLR